MLDVSARPLMQKQLIEAASLVLGDTAHGLAMLRPPLHGPQQKQQQQQQQEKERQWRGDERKVLDAIGSVETTMPIMDSPLWSPVDWSRPAWLSPHSSSLELPAMSASALLAASRLTNSATPVGSSTDYQQRLRALAQQLEHMAAAIQPRDGSESTVSSRFERLHPDTKCLQAMYREYHKRCDLTAGADKDTSDLPEKRARRPPSSSALSSVQPTHCIPDTVSPGYGECTRASFDKISQYLCDELPAPLRMGQDSVFLDIGSGYGKCVVHARFRAGVK